MAQQADQMIEMLFNHQVEIVAVKIELEHHQQK